MNLSIYLDAPKEYFVNWLQSYTLNAPMISVSTEHGHINLQRARQSRIFNTWEIEGVEVIYRDSEGNLAIPHAEMILFKITPLTSARIKIIAECRYPVAMGYFLHLLEEIDKNWPQSADFKTQLREIEERLINFENTVKKEFDEIKRGQTKFYELIDDTYQDQLTRIIRLIELNRLEQGEMERMLDAITRALKVILSNESNIHPDIRELLESTKSAIQKEMNLQQKFELTIPIVPYFLAYKIEWESGIGVNIEPLVDEIQGKWNDLVIKSKS